MSTSIEERTRDRRVADCAWCGTGSQTSSTSSLTSGTVISDEDNAAA